MERAAVVCNQLPNVDEARKMEREWSLAVATRQQRLADWAARAAEDTKRAAALRAWFRSMKEKEVLGAVVPGQVPASWVLSVQQCQQQLADVDKGMQAYATLCQDELAAYTALQELFRDADAPTLSKVNDCNVRRLRVQPALGNVTADIERKLTSVRDCDLLSLCERAAHVQRAVADQEQAAALSKTLDDIKPAQPAASVQDAPLRVPLPVPVRKKVIPQVRAALFPDYTKPFRDLEDAQNRLKPYGYLPLLEAPVPGQDAVGTAECAAEDQAERAALHQFYEDIKEDAADYLSEAYPSEVYQQLEHLLLRQMHERLEALQELLSMAQADRAQFMDLATKLLLEPALSDQQQAMQAEDVANPNADTTVTAQQESTDSNNSSNNNPPLTSSFKRGFPSNNPSMPPAGRDVKKRKTGPLLRLGGAAEPRGC